MAASVHDIAAAIIEQQTAAGRQVDKMQLQKLLYLVQGAHLRLAGRPAFRGDFLAYKNGPVIEQVESTYRPVVSDRDPIPAPLGGDSARVDDDLSDTIEHVLGIYGTWTAPNLERQTKRPGSPWQIARGDLPSGAPSREVIPLSEIARWFLTHPVDPSGKPDTSKPDEPSESDAWFWSEGWQEREREADEDIKAGRVGRYDDIDSFLADLG